jgi:hypothetical protein
MYGRHQEASANKTHKNLLEAPPRHARWQDAMAGMGGIGQNMAERETQSLCRRLVDKIIQKCNINFLKLQVRQGRKCRVMRRERPPHAATSLHTHDFEFKGAK